jgi:hypothetical protein
MVAAVIIVIGDLVPEIFELILRAKALVVKIAGQSVFCSSHNKLPQIYQLKIAQVYYVTILKVRNPTHISWG